MQEIRLLKRLVIKVFHCFQIEHIIKSEVVLR